MEITSSGANVSSTPSSALAHGCASSQSGLIRKSVSGLMDIRSMFTSRLPEATRETVFEEVFTPGPLNCIRSKA